MASMPSRKGGARRAARFSRKAWRPRRSMRRAAKNPLMTKKAGRRKVWMKRMKRSAAREVTGSLSHQTSGKVEYAVALWRATPSSIMEARRASKAW
jgi:hypothetical protein